MLQYIYWPYLLNKLHYKILKNNTFIIRKKQMAFLFVDEVIEIYSQF